MLLLLLISWSVLHVCADVFSIIPDNKQVLALDSNDDGIVIITTESITQYTIDHWNNTVRQIGQSALPVSGAKMDDFLELKLLDSNRTAFCIRSSCWYCSKSLAGYTCSNLNLHAFNRTIERLRSASIVYRNSKLFLQIVNDEYQSTILAYDVEHTSTTKEYNFTQAVDFFTQCDIICREPLEHSFGGNPSISSASAVIFRAKSISQDISTISATYYSTRGQKYELYLAVVRQASYQTICSFNTKTIDKMLDGIEGGDNCDGRKTIHEPLIYVGNIVSQFGYSSESKIQLILMDKSSGSLLLSTKPDYGIESSIFWSTPILTNVLSDELSVRQRIGVSENNLLYINKTSVNYLKISCENLYPTCETFDNGYDAVMDCAWCLDSTVSKAVNWRATCHSRYNRTNHCPKDYTKVNNPSETTTTLRPTRPSTPIFKSADVAVTTNSVQSRPITLMPTTLPDVTTTTTITHDAKSVKNVVDKFTNYLLFIIPIVILALICSIIFMTIRDAKDRRNVDMMGSDDSKPFISPQIIPAVNDHKRLFTDLNENLKIDAQHLQFNDSIENIGEGNFGFVKLAIYSGPNAEPRKVACKLLKEDQGTARDCFVEGTTMSKFVHNRVIELVGIAYVHTGGLIIVTDFMLNGDLLSHIRRPDERPTIEQRIIFAIQIAEGMAYLHSKKFIHRDLAARNCMPDSDMEVKIGDFGLARECNEDGEYLNKNSQALPYRWTAPEAMSKNLFTQYGDVWSFGVVVWELMSLGAVPYDSMCYKLVYRYLEDGDRLKKPSDCPDLLYKDIMLECWLREMHKRPPFAAILYLLKKYLKEMQTLNREQLTSI